ncbi:hypothetical protein EV360DRAFT_89564 [Lentinula raphanica]|nr:hypothetical protein EV360DRAFT_89564 [Lentinula raphanica]
MKEVPEGIQTAINHIQTHGQFGQRIDEDAENIRGILREDENLRDSVIAWMVSNFRRSDIDVNYHDEGVLQELLTATILNMAHGAEKAVQDAVDMLETMLTELKSEYFGVPPQRNIFQIAEPTLRSEEGIGEKMRNAVQTSHIEHKTKDEKNDLSDLSELSDLTESDEEENKDVDMQDYTIREETVKEKKRGCPTTQGGSKYTANRVENITIVRRWANRLQKIIGLSVSAEVPETVTDEVVGVIREMKKLGKGRYNTPEFREAVKDSGVTAIIEEICDPVFKLLNRNAQVLWLEHTYRIGDQLGEILDRWTPTEIRNTWGKELKHFESHTKGKTCITTPKDFIEVFNIHHQYVPGEENLSYCFFLTSLENFVYNYDRWLGKLLVKLEYDVTNFNNVDNLSKFYPWLMSQIHQWCTKEQYTANGKKMKTIDVKTFKSERWRTIIKKTWWLRQVGKQSAEHAKDLIHCKECVEEPATARCCQYVYKPHITHGLLTSAGKERLRVLEKELRGAGITMVPKGAQVECKDDDPKYVRKLYHPDSVGETDPIKLDGLEADMGVIKRCGHQLKILIEDKDISEEEVQAVDWESHNAKDIVDIIWWRPFDAEKLALLQDTIVESTGVQALKRGAQFRSFGGGKMIPIGARTPSGGREGDAYTTYAGLEAHSQQGLEILFNQAATSAMMLAATKMVYPKLAIELKDLSAECDKIGLTGANIYNCTGYMAPIHQDKDVTRGLCVQALLSAEPAYKEYAFCNIEYQYYISTTTNCMWSFKSSNLHGTMLPSRETIENLNSHAIDPMRIPISGIETEFSQSTAANEKPGEEGEVVVEEAAEEEGEEEPGEEEREEPEEL